MSTKVPGRHTGRKIRWRERGITIEVDHLQGAGGEGEVYSVRQHPELAVKIYHEDRRPTGTMAEKISAMEAIRLDFSKSPAQAQPRIAWPEKVIKESNSDQVTGIVMPMVDRGRTDAISQFLNVQKRKRSLPKYRTTEDRFLELRPLIARNVVTAVKVLHEAECVIGDVNDENILINPATGEATIIDCDAFQVVDRKNRAIHRCKVGREQFTPPEMLELLIQDECKYERCRRRREEGRHKPDYSCLERRPEHDMFGIGVILFTLFMNTHPYAQKAPPTRGQTTLKDHILNRRYPYGRRGPGPNVAPVNQKSYQVIPDSLKELFLRTFS